MYRGAISGMEKFFKQEINRGNSNSFKSKRGLNLPQQSVFDMSVYDNILGIAQMSIKGSLNQKSVTEKLLDEFNLQHLRTQMPQFYPEVK